MLYMRIFVVLLAMCFSLSVMAECEKYKLENGMEVILEHSDRLPFVAVSVWYHVGSVNEVIGKTGFAHLFEHLMFTGSLHAGNHTLTSLQDIGATEVNGSTTIDRTNYYEVVPSNELEYALWLESDRMGFLPQSMTQEKLDEQRGVVKNEKLQRFDNQPYGTAMLKLWDTMFPLGHPYHGQTIGSMADLDAASLDDVQAFFKRYYSPANATLALVGNFDPKTIKATVQKYFGSLKGVAKPDKPHFAMPIIEKQIVLREVEPLGKLARISMQYVTPALFTQEDADFDVLSSVLTGDKSSRLHKRLVFDDRLVQAIDAAQMSLGHGSVFLINAVVNEGVDPDKVIAIIDEEIAALKTKPPTEKELRQAINKLETQRLFSLQKLGGDGGRAELFQIFNHHLGKPDLLQWDMERYQKVTPQTIMSAVNRYLNPSQRAVLIAVPAAKGNQP